MRFLYTFNARTPDRVHSSRSYFLKICGIFRLKTISGQTLATSRWIHVAHAFKNGESRVYVNDVLDGVSTSKDAPLAITSPARMYLGGWYDNYRFVGDRDEVRISKVTRSADWVKLQYENQKPLQTVVGPLVQAGTAFSVSEKQIALLENQSTVVTAKAGGAQKVYWLIRRGGRESVAAVDRFAFTLDVGRVTGSESLTLQFQAVYADTVKTLDIPVTIKEDIPEPVLTLRAPTTWDGRETIEVESHIANLQALQAKGADALKYQWTASGLAVIKEIGPGKLILKRAQNSGKLAMTAAVNNGGAPTTQTLEIVVTEPGQDAWLHRIPDKDEKPVDHQFFARDDKNEGALYYNGTLRNAADSVFLKVYADDEVIKTESQKLKTDKTYAFTVKLKPGLIKYQVQFGSKSGNTETVLHTVANLVCGDAYLIDGQSNAVATDWGSDEFDYSSDWIRSFGSMGGDVSKGWGNAVRRKGDAWEIGYWGMDLARSLVDSQRRATRSDSSWWHRPTRKRSPILLTGSGIPRTCCTGRTALPRSRSVQFR
ncbi:MAG: LamG-like jellyroll fold domain-containing protein [Pirellulaceae bacterium]